MSAINRLSKVYYLDPSDLVAMFSQNLGDDAAVTLQNLANYLQTLLTAESAQVTQYAAPTTTGFTVTIDPPEYSTSVFLLLSPSGTLAAGTIVLPAAVDGQEVLVHSRQTVTALTLTPAGGDAVSGAPTTVTVTAPFRLRYDAVNKLWCRTA